MISTNSFVSARPAKLVKSQSNARASAIACSQVQQTARTRLPRRAPPLFFYSYYSIGLGMQPSKCHVVYICSGHLLLRTIIRVDLDSKLVWASIADVSYLAVPTLSTIASPQKVADLGRHNLRMNRNERSRAQRAAGNSHA